jgi:hypothetical protein
MAQADTRTVSVRAGAADLTPVGNKELSSARKKRKATKRERATVRSGADVGGGRNARGPGEDRREESGSAM